MTAVREAVTEIVASVPDPEIPVVTIAELGILRSVDERDGRVTVTITPTYSGCPALEQIAGDIVAALDAGGHRDVAVNVALSPAWTTDWITPQGRSKLRAFGIAPPPEAATAAVPLMLSATRLSASAPSPACPQCDSTDTEELSRFGSTACKSLHRCRTCREPFDHFKALQ